MPQVFISYAHADPDRELAAELARFLQANGCAVFVDSKILLGQDWVEQIDSQLRKSEYFIVLLSPASVESDMVRREIAIAYKLKKAKQLTIFPVRVGFEGDLPYDLGAYLDSIQHAAWRPGQPAGALCRTMLEALGSSSSSAMVKSEPKTPAPGTDPARTPAPSRFDKLELDRLRGELARHVGPFAKIIVDRAARKAANWEQLYDALALEIPAQDDRKKFLATRTHRG